MIARMDKQLLTVLFIDSDQTSVNHILKWLRSNSLISMIDHVTDTDHALLKIIRSSPDIVFIEYPVRGNAGEELIEFIKTKLVETIIVFISDSKMHAAAAIRSGIFNFLLKPVSKSELNLFIEKVYLSGRTNSKERIAKIIEQNYDDTKLKLQTTRGYLLINPDEIIYCKADGVYTQLYLSNNRVETSYLFLSKVEEFLKPYNFMKVSRSCIINVRYLRKVFRDNNTIILSINGKEYEVKGSKQSIRELSQIETE